MRALDAAVATLAETPGGLGPAEDLLDALTDFLACGMRKGQEHVQGLLSVFARGVRHYALLANASDELLRVIAFICADSLRFEAAVAQLDHLVDGDRRLCSADRRLNIEQDAQAVAILHRRV